MIVALGASKGKSRRQKKWLPGITEHRPATASMGMAFDNLCLPYASTSAYTQAMRGVVNVAGAYVPARLLIEEIRNGGCC